MNDIGITLAGNLVAHPELRYTPNGTALTRFRVASTPRAERAGKWTDIGEPVFLTIVAWRALAENVAATLRKGSPVVIVGRLRQRSFTADDGTLRSAYEVHADEVSPSLRFAAASAAPEQPALPGPATEPTAEPDTADVPAEPDLAASPVPARRTRRSRASSAA